MTEPSVKPMPSPAVLGDPLLESVRRYVPLLAWVVIIAAVLFIPLKIIGYGYLPPDDALRHAAQGVSGKPWGEVVVLGEPLKVDFQFGWDLILRRLHQWFGVGAEGLAEISVVTLFILLNAAVLPWLKRPEAWFGALAASWLAANPGDRFFLGRPFMVTMSALVVILMGARAVGAKGPRWRDLGWIAPVIGLACYVHGTWYLWLLPVAAFFLAGQFRWSVAIGAGWLMGAALAGLATGQPVAYWTEAVRVAFRSVGSFTTQSMMAIELQPILNLSPFIVLGAMLLARQSVKAAWRPLRSEPGFWLVCIGWILGCSAGRFWYDWGIAGLLVIMTLDLQTLLEISMPLDSLQRLLAVAVMTVGMYAATTADIGGRWTGTLHDRYFTQDDADLATWMPDPGGIFYAATMSVFYQTYFRNPNAPWRYILGFEPTLMPADDFAIYHSILWSYGDDNAYTPWVKKMRPSDRLVLVIGGAPQIPALEWKHAFGAYWIGRLPRAHGPADPKTAK
jgi:hypothetical protein